MQRHELWAEVDVLLGGRAAEEVFFGEVSTGAGNDLERATDIIKSMVQVYGMSDVAGLMVLEKQRQSFIGGGMQSSREYSENIAQEMDAFIKKSLDEHYKDVKLRLEEYRQAIEDIVELLYEKENISGKQVREIIEKFEKENGIDSKLQELSESDKQHQDDSEKSE